jgi:hypothetical protein
MANADVCLNSATIETISTDKVKAKKPEEQKCAPGVKFEAGSCITLPVLIAMAEAYNKVNNNKIKLSCRKETLHPNRYKKYLLKRIGDRYKNTCTTQLCWTQQDFVKKMNEEMKLQLEKFTLRPSGPEGKFEWLNTININEVMEQYQQVHPEFLFLGAVPMDFNEIKQDGIYNLDLNETKKDKITKFGIVFNLDEHWQSGSHWVAAYADMEKGQVYYFDSYGTHPEKRVTNLMNKFAKHYDSTNPGKKCKVDYNKTRYQYKNSECGVYSINFILDMLNGKSFQDILNNPIPDEEINKLRENIFRNVSFSKK